MNGLLHLKEFAAWINTPWHAWARALTAGAWNEGVGTPPAAKIAGFISMASWIGVVIVGRTVPFLGPS